jgi:beta-glucosidase/6-phospho-beta-glucosidase/beta-galactosidase
MKPAETPFFWGVATSGFQSEGGFNGEGEPLNNWVWTERAGTAARSGTAADFWNHSTADFARCRELGLNAFRLGLEWARIQPSTHFDPQAVRAPAPPPFDDQALHRYAALIADCTAHGLEPIVTWQHFTHPAWLGPDAWLRRETVDHFIVYVRHSLRYLKKVLAEEFQCPMPRYFITVNEPALLAFNQYFYCIFPGSWRRGILDTGVALSRLMEAHARAYLVIHEELADPTRPPQVSFNNYCSDLYWTDAAWLDLFFCPQHNVPSGETIFHLRRRASAFDRAFHQSGLLRPRRFRYYLGEMLKKIHSSLSQAIALHPCWKPVLELIYASPRPLLDFIAIDYYDPFVSHALRWPHWRDHEPKPRSFRDWALESITSKWWEWRALPKGLAFFVEHLSAYGLPIMIAENGMAQRRSFANQSLHRRDRLVRSVYLRDHVRMVAQLKQEGHPLIGYLHWSLFDNYEWGSFTPRFGLYSVDYAHGSDRQTVDPWGDQPSQTYREEIALAREQWNDQP